MGPIIEKLEKKHIGEECVICENIKIKGIHLYNSFICVDCERDILLTDTNNPKYKFYLKQLKKVSLEGIS